MGTGQPPNQEGRGGPVENHAAVSMKLKKWSKWNLAIADTAKGPETSALAIAALNALLYAALHSSEENDADRSVPCERGSRIQLSTLLECSSS